MEGLGFGQPPDFNNTSIIHAIDCHGVALLPGFIDLYFHGAAGHEVMDASPVRLAEMVGAALLLPELTCELICDLDHVHPASMYSQRLLKEKFLLENISKSDAVVQFLHSGVLIHF